NPVWVKSEDGSFEATFEFESAAWEAEFDAEGNWLESSKELAEVDMPAKAMEYLKVFYADLPTEFEYVKIPDLEMYCAEMMKDSTEMEVCFDMDGNVSKDKNNVVLAKLNEISAGATDIVWTKLEDESYNAVYSLDDYTWKTGFNADGSWICSGAEIPAEELPAVVNQYLEKMNSFMVESSKMRVTIDGEQFVVDGKMKEASIRFIFDQEGNFIEQVELPEVVAE
ncbi:PepSY-like domain-containing protein, partial [Bacteroidota bacterium]